jgi:hypothetical protein
MVAQLRIQLVEALPARRVVENPSVLRWLTAYAADLQGHRARSAPAQKDAMRSNDKIAPFPPTVAADPACEQLPLCGNVAHT